jgi:hypothetical protein
MGIYGSNAIEINQEQLNESFNSWARHRQFVVADEVTGSDKRAVADKIKSYITHREIIINVKYEVPYTLPDCINYYFTSQHPDAMMLDDTDRRFFVWEFPSDPAPSDFYTRYSKWYRSADGTAALFDYLLNIDTSSFDPSAPAMWTDAKRAMVVDSKSDLGSFVAQLRDDPDTVLSAFGRDVDLLCSRQLVPIHDPIGNKHVSANGMGRELKRAGFKVVNGGKPVMTCQGLMNLYAVRNMTHWIGASPRDIVRAYNKWFPKMKL